MGTYVYGVSSKKKNVKGLDEPVYLINYIYKPNWYYDDTDGNRRGELIVSRYESKPSMKGKLVMHNFNKDDDAFGETMAVEIERYKYNSNTYRDGSNEMFERVGYAYKVGKRFHFVEYFEDLPDTGEIKSFVTDDGRKKPLKLGKNMRTIDLRTDEQKKIMVGPFTKISRNI